MIGDLPCVRGHDQMNLVLARIDLVEQTLQINAAAGPGGADHDLHKQPLLASFRVKSACRPRNSACKVPFSFHSSARVLPSVLTVEFTILSSGNGFPFVWN